MRNVKNTNQKDFSVETAEGGFHAIRAGETELVDLNEHKIDEYRSKGFEISDPVESEEPEKQPPAGDAGAGGTGAQAGDAGAGGTGAQAGGESQPVAKKPEGAATQTTAAPAPAKEADKKNDK